MASKLPKPYKSGSIFYADNKTAQLLKGYAAAFTSPATAGWIKVKQNPSRTVYKGIIDGVGEVYLKQFHSRVTAHKIRRQAGLSDAKKEFTFARILISKKIETAVPLAYRSDAQQCWILTKSLDPAMPLDKWHEQQLSLGPQGAARIRICTKLIAGFIAKLHAAGIEHMDLHCGNIFIAKSSAGVRLAVMDLHRIKQHLFMGRRRRSINIALLMHDRLPSTSMADRLRFLKEYLKCAKTTGTLRGWAWAVEFFWQKHARKLYSQRDRRITGRNKYFSRVKLSGGYSGHVILESKRRMLGSKAAATEFKLSEWQLALKNPEKLFTGDDVELIKDSASSKIVRRKLKIGPNEIDVFIKRSKRKKKWKILADCLRQPRAINCFKLGHMLITRRVPTPLPMAALQKRVGPFLVDNILITEALDAPHIHEFFNRVLSLQPANAPRDPEWNLKLNRMVEHLGKALQNLHDLGFIHRDLKATNIRVYEPDSDNCQIAFLDLDGLSKVRHVWLRQRYKGLMRIMVALMSCPEINNPAMLRLLMSYMRRPGSGRLYYKPYWRLLERWGNRKRKKQLKSRQKKQRKQRFSFSTKKST